MTLYREREMSDMDVSLEGNAKLETVFADMVTDSCGRMDGLAAPVSEEHMAALGQTLQEIQGGNLPVDKAALQGSMAMLEEALDPKDFEKVQMQVNEALGLESPQPAPSNEMTPPQPAPSGPGPGM